MVVLHKRQGDPRLLGIALRLEGLQEEAAVVTEDLGFDQLDVRDRGVEDLHQSCSLHSRARYWP